MSLKTSFGKLRYMETIQFLSSILFFFFLNLTSTSNYFTLSSSALSNPGFLFSECAHMFFISTQPRFIRGVVLPWVISFLKTNLIMPLRKFYLKIHVGVCCSQPRPGDSWEGLHSAAAAAQSTWPSRPADQAVKVLCQDPHLPWAPRDARDICQNHWEALYSGLIPGFM